MMMNAWIYEVVQCVAGSRRIRAHLAPHLGRLSGQRVLDIGAGTGLYTRAIGDVSRYVALDTDVRRLDVLARKYPDAETVAADARRLPFSDDTFDAALCIFVAHHFDDHDFAQLLSEASRVSSALILLDPLATDRTQGRLLWRIDRGSYPRTESGILSEIEQWFGDLTVERFTIRHDYLLCIGHRKLRPESVFPAPGRDA